MQQVRRLRWFCLFLAWGAACGGPGEATFRPQPLLSQSAEAQLAFRRLQERWVSSPPTARYSLEPQLTQFVQQYPTDGHARRVRLYLAWLSLSSDRVANGKRWLRAARSDAAGTSSDFYSVVEATWLLKVGQPEKAYARLQPLAGSLVEPDDRLLCLISLVSAAIAVGREQEAVQHIVELATQSTRRHRESVWPWLVQRLGELAPRTLEWALQSPPTATTGTRAELRAARSWLTTEVRRRLSQSALASKDVGLAQRLLSTGSAAARTQASTELVELATHAGRAPTVRGRRFGLVLQLDKPANQFRSTELLRGVTYALDHAVEDSSPQLLTRVAESSAQLADSIRELAAEGAALVICALGPDDADTVARMAPTSIPILLVHPPSGAPLPSNMRTVGESEQLALELLSKNLGGEGTPVLDLSAREEACKLPTPGQDEEAIRASQPQETTLVLLQGPRGCSERLLPKLQLEPTHTTLALGLGALNLSLKKWSRLADHAFTLRVGQLGVGKGDRVDSLQRWQAEHGIPPSWYEALGRDTGRIARAALASEPRQEAPVEQAHANVLRRLDDSTYLDLWTTRASRFSEAGHLPRSVTVVPITQERQ